MEKTTEIITKLRRLMDRGFARQHNKGPNLHLDLEGWRELYEFIAGVDIPDTAGIRGGARLALYFTDWILWFGDEWAKLKEVKTAIRKIEAADTAQEMVAIARGSKEVAGEVLAIANIKFTLKDPDGIGNAGRYQAAMVAIASAFLISVADYTGVGDHPLKGLLADVVGRFKEMANTFSYAYGHQVSISTIVQIWEETEVDG